MVSGKSDRCAVNRTWLTLFFFLLAPLAAHAQSVELPCPSGTFPVPGNTTTNTNTGKLRQNLCMDVAGNFYPTITGTFTFTNHNAMYWAGPGPTPTIDQAAANCGASPCWVEISPLYTGPESTKLITISTGHQIYAGALNVTVSDRRGSTAGAGLNYPILYGARLAGQLVRMGVNGWFISPTDSTAAATSINWVQGSMPANSGTMNGGVGVVILHDAIVFGASTSPLVGQDGEADVASTSSDVPVPAAFGVNGQCNIIRANTTQGITRCVGLRAANNNNASISGATIVNSYGFDSEVQTAGTSRNYGYHSNADWLTENQTHFDAVDSGGVPRHIVFFRLDNGIDLTPLADASGFTFKTQGGAGLLRILNTSINSLVTHVFSSNLNFTNMLFSATAPTIAAAGCGGAAASIAANNGTAAFSVNVGTTPGTTCTITLPTSVNGWVCDAFDFTNPTTGGGYYVKETGGTTTTIVLTFFSTAGAATAPTASDVVRVKCSGF